MLDRFLVRDARARPILKGEGELHGTVFELTTWRREGLLMRLRNRGLLVSTLEDQIAALPGLPAPVLPGPTFPRALSSAAERFSLFDAQLLGWQPLTAEPGQPALVHIPAGAAIRRRRGRGAADYYITLVDRGGNLALQSSDELHALLHGYAQAAALDSRPLLATRTGEMFELPAIEWPEPHQALLRRFAQQRERAFVTSGRGWDLAHLLFARLGLALGEESGSQLEG
jgi:hypothetical protein